MLPVHLKPKRDEILSSWLVRLAMAHGMKVHSFSSLVLSNKAIWNRDIDKSVDNELLEILSKITGTSTKAARDTTLQNFEGYLYEKRNKFGTTPWILPIGVYHRKRVHYGMQFCSTCLAEDKTPYFRRKWRLVFMTICEKHKIPLSDRCFNCQHPVNFHRNELGNFHKLTASSLTVCYNCKIDLREDSPIRSQFLIRSDEVNFTKKLLKASKDGFIKINEEKVVYSFHFFIVLHQIIKTLSKPNKKISKLKNIILNETNFIPYSMVSLENLNTHLDVQEQSVSVRRQLLLFAGYLLDDWSSRFIRLSTECKLWSSLWLKNIDGSKWKRARVAPYWFWKVVYENLNRRKYYPTDTEITEAVKHLIKNNKEPNRLTVSKLLGRVYIRRPHKGIKSNQ